MNDLKLGWLSPTAELIECNSYDHWDTADKLVEKYGYPVIFDEHLRYLPSDDILLKNGWVHIGVSSLGTKEWMIFWDKKLTDYQKNFLRPYFEDEKIPMCISALSRWEYEENFGV